MNWPLYDNGVLSGLVIGFLFGLALEGAGFGSPKKLTAQFRLNDWAVFKVMFTAVITTAVLLWVAKLIGWMDPGSYFVPTPYFWGMAIGGLLIGAGFAIGGYCPGTSVAGFAGGRLDALVFMLGMVLGTGLFAAWFGPLEGLYFSGQGQEAMTLMDLTGLPEWLILVVMVAVAVGGFRLGSYFERRLGGPLTAEQILEDQR